MTDPLPRRITWFAPWTWKRRRLWMLGASPLVLMLVYVLSLGPALLYVEKTNRGYEEVYRAYAPLIALRKHAGSGYAMLLDRYANMWSSTFWGFMRIEYELRDSDILKARV